MPSGASEGSGTRCGGRPKVNRAADLDAKAIRKLRDEGQSYGEIASELSRSKADVYRVCMTLGCLAQ
jgi:DNA invertase Pin-like site-specific DNA recombinase